MYGTMTRAGRRAFAAGRIAVLCLVLTAAGLGCTMSRGADPFISQAEARINIEVINHNFQDVTLHAVWTGGRVRLGTVSGTRTANFMLPWNGSQELRFEIDLLASSECVTRPIWADPGDIILVEIEMRMRIGIDCF